MPIIVRIWWVILFLPSSATFVHLVAWYIISHPPTGSAYNGHIMYFLEISFQETSFALYSTENPKISLFWKREFDGINFKKNVDYDFALESKGNNRIAIYQNNRIVELIDTNKCERVKID